MARMERDAVDLQRAPRAGRLAAQTNEHSPRAGGISAALGGLLPIGRRARP
jgi:hypothetical protein